HSNDDRNHEKNHAHSVFHQTADGIAMNPITTEVVLDNREVPSTLPGSPPYVRCPRATMHTTHP
ncbi:hypothetical protein, partial [Escherichia coli]|uniref:hypothetical protein n=1 Tax=Escherichia coli TaxID=562 RepID=UPI00386012EF